MTNKYLYLPLEIVIREHDGKATLAHEAAMAGWTVVMGPKIPLYNVLDQLPEGVIFIKSATPLELGQMKALRRSGHRICSLDEEGVVTFREFLGNNVRYSADTVAEIDCVFFWGDEQQRVFNENYPAYSGRGCVSGSARFEFWRDYAADVYGATAEAYRKEYGNYILLPTSFGIGNNVMGGDMGLQLTKRHSGKLTKELVRFMEGQAEQNLVVFKEYLDFLPHIARAFPETNFVIRPHPSEAHDAWKNLAADFPNLHLRYEGSVTPWILGAAAMFHFKSTTSVEAHIMGRKAITYVPPLPPYMDKYELELPMAVSRVARSRDALMQILRDVLKEERFVKPGAIDGVLGEWISVDPGRSSAARIVGKLEEYAPKPQRMWGAVEARKSFREKVERGLSSLDKTSARAYLPGRIRARLDSLSYGAHKASGMDISHTRKIIQTIGKKCGPDHVSVSALSEDVFVIKKDS